MSFFQTLISVLIFAATAQAQTGDLPSKVSVNFNKVYAVGGFDDNDNVQIVGEGMFAKTCYRHAETTVRVDEATKIIYLSPVAYKYNGYCLQVILPFSRVIDVGILKAGTYSVELETNKQSLGEITIRPSLTRAADDYLYAPVSQSFFVSKNGSNTIQLAGDFSLSCMKMKDVKIDIQKGIVVVQPIAKIDKSVPCTAGDFPFEKVIQVGPLAAGRYLMHVRSLNGQSLNTLINIK